MSGSFAKISVQNSPKDPNSSVKKQASGEPHTELKMIQSADTEARDSQKDYPQDIHTHKGIHILNWGGGIHSGVQVAQGPLVLPDPLMATGGHFLKHWDPRLLVDNEQVSEFFPVLSFSPSGMVQNKSPDATMALLQTSDQCNDHF